MTALCLGATEVEPAERLKITGTAITFASPLPLSPADGFAGFENVDLQLAIMGFELPVPADGDALAEFEQMLTAESLQQRGVELEQASRISLEQSPALLLKCRQTRSGVPYRKYMLIVPSEGKVAHVMISLPSEKDPQVLDQLEATIRSFRVEKDVADFTRPYVLELPDDWTFARHVGVVAVYSPGGQFPILPGGASLGVTNLNEAVPVTRLAEYVKSKNLKRNYYTGLKELTSVDMLIDDSPANLSIVSATEAETGEPVVLQYCYIFLANTTYLIESRRGPQMADDRFERIAKSWRLQRTTPSGR
jgi:hypothetical protein